jgi:Fe-S-cluster containining protein
MRPCLRCGLCCATHPCALSPRDLDRISSFLGLSSDEAFRSYFVLDHARIAGRRHYYVSPARLNDEAGKLASPEWTFEDSPCVFLRGKDCAIEHVKPLGGRALSCRLMTGGARDRIRFGKRRAAMAWCREPSLKRLLSIANENRNRPAF